MFAHRTYQITICRVLLRYQSDLGADGQQDGPREPVCKLALQGVNIVGLHARCDTGVQPDPEDIVTGSCLLVRGASSRSSRSSSRRALIYALLSPQSFSRRALIYALLSPQSFSGLGWVHVHTGRGVHVCRRDVEAGQETRANCSASRSECVSSRMVGALQAVTTDAGF
jgi:hypothetical protein